MQIVNRCVIGFIAASVSAFAGARDLPPDQPPIWSTKPDVNAFEKIEIDRLEAAQRRHPASALNAPPVPPYRCLPG